MVRAHAFVSGKVQGVYFRESTVQEASRRGVVGWVRNVEDGRVEAVFQGERDAVEALVLWCHSGPPAAVVSRVDVVWDEAEEAFAGFERRPTRGALRPGRV